MRTIEFSIRMNLPGKVLSTFFVDLVENRAEARRGLSGQSVEKGMLFPGNGRKEVSITGAGMLESVTVLFIDINRRVIESKLLVPNSTINYSGEPVEWILELPIK